MTEEKNELVAVYLSFKTFQSAIALLRSHGLPSDLDKSAWPSRSGGEQSAIWSAFKFLGLIDEKGHVQEMLHKLYSVQENSNEEKELLRHLLMARYAKVFELNLGAATPNQFEDAIGTYNVAGSTKYRAIRFFIKAAEHAGVKVSERLRKGFRNVATPKRNGASKRNDQEIDQDTEIEEEADEHSSRQIKTITLPGVAGTMTISGTFNAFELEGDERDLVYKIVDLMKTFEKQHGNT